MGDGALGGPEMLLRISARFPGVFKVAVVDKKRALPLMLLSAGSDVVACSWCPNLQLKQIGENELYELAVCIADGRIDVGVDEMRNGTRVRLRVSDAMLDLSMASASDGAKYQRARSTASFIRYDVRLEHRDKGLAFAFLADDAPAGPIRPRECVLKLPRTEPFSSALFGWILARDVAGHMVENTGKLAHDLQRLVDSGPEFLKRVGSGWHVKDDDNGGW